MPYNQRGGNSPKKEKINEWVGQGIVRPRSGNDTDEIRFFPFQQGGGAIHITLQCSEVVGADANGAPRTKVYFVPVDVVANKLITVQQLQSVRSGMYVRVVGRLDTQSYTSKKTGQKVSTLVVSAYVFEVLRMPEQPYAPQAQPQGAYPPNYGAYPQPQQGGVPLQNGYPQPGAPQTAYPPQGGYPQPGYGAYPPQGGFPVQGQPQPAYPPQGQPAYGQAMPPQGGAPAAPQGQPQPGVPPYYQPPMGGAPPVAPQGPQGQPQPGAAPAAPIASDGMPIDPEDMPPA